MRIGVLCPYSLSAPGGVQDQVQGLASEFRRLGHEVDVIAPCDGVAPSGVITSGRSIRFRVNGSTAPMAPTPTAAIRTVRTLRERRYDVLHLHEPLAPSITIPALLARTAPIVGTFHAAGERTPYRWFGMPLRRLAARIDVRVAVSEAAMQLAQRHLGGRYEVLFNGIDAQPFASAPASPVERPMILFLGRHEPRKGLEVLLSAMVAVPDDAELWVAGDGPDRVRLQRTFGRDPRIRWLGRVSESTKLAHLRAASVVCVPSLHGESFGLTLLEAMAAGTPVVASDLPGYRSLAVDGAAAVLVPPGDPDALAAGLTRVLGEAALTGSLRAAGMAQVTDFALDALARRYVAIFERVA